QLLTDFLFSVAGNSKAFAVILRTTEKSVWANEFECDLEHRALLREPANLLILNTSRSDTAQYRCEVAAIDDQKPFDEILISLAVRVKPVMPRCSVPEAVTVGSSPELRCIENEGFPQSLYQWFKNSEELPEDPKTSSKFYNSTYTMNTETGSLKFRSVKKEDAGEYYCQARNEAGWSKCSPQPMEVYDLDIVGIFLKVLGGVAAFIFVIVGICQIQKSGYCSCKDHRETKDIFATSPPLSYKIKDEETSASAVKALGADF
ncbi:Junctional adhesion molecule C, partial [Anabarilius grahami]